MTKNTVSVSAPKPTPTPQETANKWLSLPRLEELNENTITPLVNSLSAQLATGSTLVQFADGGYNKHDRLRRAEAGELAIIIVDNVVYRPPTRRRLEAWLVTGERDVRRGEASLFATLVEAGQAARVRGVWTAYDEIVWAEMRMLQPASIPNPEYHGENNANVARMIVNPLYLDAPTAGAIIKSKQWRLERLLPATFGSNININQQTNVKIELVDTAPSWVQRAVADRAAKAIDVTPDSEND